MRALSLSPDLCLYAHLTWAWSHRMNKKLTKILPLGRPMTPLEWTHAWAILGEWVLATSCSHRPCIPRQQSQPWMQACRETRGRTRTIECHAPRHPIAAALDSLERVWLCQRWTLRSQTSRTGIPHLTSSQVSLLRSLWLPVPTPHHIHSHRGPDLYSSTHALWAAC